MGRWAGTGVPPQTVLWGRFATAPPRSERQRATQGGGGPDLCPVTGQFATAPPKTRVRATAEGGGPDLCPVRTLFRATPSRPAAHVDKRRDPRRGCGATLDQPKAGRHP